MKNSQAIGLALKANAGACILWCWVAPVLFAIALAYHEEFEGIVPVIFFGSLGSLLFSLGHSWVFFLPLSFSLKSYWGVAKPRELYFLAFFPYLLCLALPTYLLLGDEIFRHNWELIGTLGLIWIHALLVLWSSLARLHKRAIAFYLAQSEIPRNPKEESVVLNPDQGS